MAYQNTILRVRVGSELYGTAVTESSDRDEMGVCIPPPDYLLGLKPFDQFEWHDAWGRPGGRANKSGLGDLDVKIYSLRKFVTLALKGNPAMIEMLYAPAPFIVSHTGIGFALQACAQRIVSREAAPRYLGYLGSQRQRMFAKQGKGDGVSRPDLMELYGFDTKFAAHMARLGFQGLELMRTGRLTLPLEERHAKYVRAVRRGEFSMEEVLAQVQVLEAEIHAAVAGSPLPEHPDHDWVDGWLITAHRQHWQSSPMVSWQGVHSST